MKKIISSRLPRFRIYAFLISTVVLSFSHPEANATVIFYEVQNLGGTTWEYSYTVENDTLGSDIEEFTIYFDLGLYENLVVVSTPADWDPLVIEPDANIPDDGFYDALALSAGISGGNTLGGVTVSFDWLGGNSSMSQYFEIIDPLTFGVLDSGQTAIVTSSVPEPSSFALLVIGLIGTAVFRKKHLTSSKLMK